jgi:hypothetical protein
MSETKRYAGAVEGTLLEPTRSLGAPDNLSSTFVGNVYQSFSEFNFELPPGEEVVGIDVKVTGKRVSTGGGGR